MKTNAARILESLSIAYEIVAYALEGEDDLAARAAEVLGLDPDSVFKTLVARGDRSGPMLAVVPASASLDLKALARASGDRRVEMVPLAEVERLTGYVRGCVTALGTKKPLPVYLDEMAEASDRIGVSAGAKGFELLLAPADYARATGATIAPISRYKNPK